MSKIDLENINDIREIYGLNFKDAKRVLEIDIALEQMETDPYEHYETIAILNQEKLEIIG